MDKAPDFGSGDCRFESCHDRFLFLHANVSMMKLFISVRLERPRGCWVTFDRNQVRSSATLLSNSLTNVVETDLMWPWRMKMPTQNLLRLLLLLMLMLRIMLQIWELTFGPKAKLLFRLWAQHKVGQDFEVEVQARFWSWHLFSILPLMFCRGYEVESWSRFRS